MGNRHYIRESEGNFTKILVESEIGVDVHEWNEKTLEQGPFVKHYDFKMPRRSFGTVKELLSAVDEVLDWKLTKADDWYFGNGIINSYEFVDKDGNRDLDGGHVANALIKISVVDEPRIPTDEEAKAMGFKV